MIADSGAMLTQVRLEILPGDKRLLHLTLPKDARFWFAFVNQNGVWPWREGDQILIPLEQQSHGDRIACARGAHQRRGAFVERRVAAVHAAAPGHRALEGDIHLGPEHALEAHALLGGGAFLPVHWGTFSLGTSRRCTACS